MLAGPLALAKVGDLTGQTADAGVGVVVGGEPLEVVGAGEAVEDLELGPCQRQPSVLVLAVEGEQATAEGS